MVAMSVNSRQGRNTASAIVLLSIAASHANASEMPGWKVTYVQADDESTVCYDPDIDRTTKEIVCFGPKPKRDPLEVGVQIVGYMSLIISAVIIGMFIAYRRGKIPHAELYSEQTTNIWIGTSVLSVLMLGAAFLDNFWKN